LILALQHRFRDDVSDRDLSSIWCCLARAFIRDCRQQFPDPGLASGAVKKIRYFWVCAGAAVSSHEEFSCWQGFHPKVFLRRLHFLACKRGRIA